MTQIITFGNFKGGVGKTTNAVQVAYELSKRNYKTLLMDLDPQANATNILLKTKANIDDELAHFDSSLMVAVQDKDLTKSIINIKENLDLMGSAPDFALFPRFMEKMFKDYTDRVQYLSKLIEPVAEKYDFVIVDIPPTISLITDAALYASDWCLVVMQTQQQSLDGASAFIDYIQDDIVNTYKAPRLDVIGILAVLIQAGAPVDETTMNNAIKYFGKENILPTAIHSMQRLKRYGITGITTSQRYDKKVFAVYKQVTDEILDRIGMSK
ncbi:AAA family ATPase [Lactobacillus sp. ESL0791]|uniref:ParA family protein n=1 Tax=Lactobacillus sp. ESL0791 TaxID=2983234 RepID=UPI0023F755F5|nr:AAA family ATPase [Lactobacillus sp. ESL0791]MDF7639969.1 AAA family ATPase [Lactobacillus sp. ESL0791]